MYGDYDNVTKDSKTIYEIMERQGQDLIIECLAEEIGKTCQKFKLPQTERMNVYHSVMDEVREAILERI